MRKRIQLRGISRTPSDRMTSDGGCAESLNVQLEEQEIAPILPPEDVTEELGLPADGERRYIYIHRGSGYENYIVSGTTDTGAYILQDGEYAYSEIFTLEEGESVHSASSIGNTIIVLSNKHTHYALFRDGKYKYLGVKIPFPTVEITAEALDDEEGFLQKTYVNEADEEVETVNYSIDRNKYVKSWTYHQGYPESYESAEASIMIPVEVEVSEDNWATLNIKKKYNGLNEINIIRELLEKVKEQVASIENDSRERGYLVHQVMIIYGIRLYDGSYLVSSPLLMPGGYESPFSVKYKRDILARYWEGAVSNYPNQSGWGLMSLNVDEALVVSAKVKYRINAELKGFNSELEEWKDIIQSIDFFMTPTVPYNLEKEKEIRCRREILPHTFTHESSDFQGLVDDDLAPFFNTDSPTTVEPTIGGNSAGINLVRYHRVSSTAFLELEPGCDEFSRDYISRLLTDTAFFLAESVPVGKYDYSPLSRLTELKNGTTLDIEKFIKNPDLIATQKKLADLDAEGIVDTRNNERIANGIQSINNRALLTNVVEIISPGLKVMPLSAIKFPETNLGYSIWESHQEPHVFDTEESSEDNVLLSQLFHKSDFNYPEGITHRYLKFVYHIKGERELCVVQRFGEQENEYVEVDANSGLFGWLTYPDPRCYAVDIYLSYDLQTWIGKRYEMHEHPLLDFSYMYLGLDHNMLWEFEGVTRYIISGMPAYSLHQSAFVNELDVHDIEEYRIDDKRSRLYLSSTDNPWIFPIKSRYTLQANKIFGAALATRPMSTGQFGQFPLYVFTDTGIWAMQMNDEGSFASAHAISREIAVGESIVSLDQSVVFLSDKGLMMVAGSEVIPLSPNMNGKHYVAEADLSALIGRSPWSAFKGAVDDSEAFLRYMKGAQYGYDYVGERLLCMNPEKDFLYVYRFPTKTWHKMSMPQGLTAPSFLNSYPNAYASAMSQNGKAHIVSFSTMLDVASTEKTKGLIITRPFALEEDDVRKTITDLRIRGNFARGDVKYVLLGSMDGIHWGILPSLRGGSYKLFRLALLTDLSPTERISWIDIDYETRFDNRLR